MPRLRFGEKSRHKGVHNRRPSKPDQTSFVTECNDEPTQIWQRRWNVGMILRNNAELQDDPKPIPEWKKESPDSYVV